MKLRTFANVCMDYQYVRVGNCMNGEVLNRGYAKDIREASDYLDCVVTDIRESYGAISVSIKLKKGM